MTSETTMRSPAGRTGPREQRRPLASRDLPAELCGDANDSAYRARRLRLMIVDHDEADRLIVRRSLARSGLSHDLDEAATPEDALQLLRGRRYDCVLLDDALPGAEAAELVEAAGAAALVAMTAAGAGQESTGPGQESLGKDELNASAIRRALLAAIETATLRRSLSVREAELASSRRELAKLARMTSRDVNEPLKIIVNFMQRLERRSGDNLDERSREYMKQIVDGSMRMQRMVTSLLDLSLVGQSEETFERCAVEDLFREAMANLCVAIADSGASVHCDRLPALTCNRQRILQLLEQLLDNAIRHRGPAQPELRFSAQPVAIDAAARLELHQAVRQQTIWQFCLEDNGPGVARDDAERIFVVFQRVQREQSADGIGMGLALCRRIVELHEGRIWVESRDGGGSRFCFTLPSERP